MKVDIDFTKRFELKVKLPRRPKSSKLRNRSRYYKRRMREIRKGLPTV